MLLARMSQLCILQGIVQIQIPKSALSQFRYDLVIGNTGATSETVLRLRKSAI